MIPGWELCPRHEAIACDPILSRSKKRDLKLCNTRHQEACKFAGLGAGRSWKMSTSIKGFEWSSEFSPPGSDFWHRLNTFFCPPPFTSTPSCPPLSWKEWVLLLATSAAYYWCIGSAGGLVPLGFRNSTSPSFTPYKWGQWKVARHLWCPAEALAGPWQHRTPFYREEHHDRSQRFSPLSITFCIFGKTFLELPGTTYVI